MKLDADRDYGGELLETLAGLERLHTDLAEVIDRKIDCMRECDVAGMNECAAHEQGLVGKISEQEGRRRALTDSLARLSGVAPVKVRRMTAAQLAERLPPGSGSALVEAADRLRSLTTRIARRNHVAGVLGRKMLGHMEMVMSAMTVPTERSGAYSPGGQVVVAAPQRLFEAVG